jgi:purine nucleoside permease
MLFRRALVLGAMLFALHRAAAAPAPLEVRVVVVATFEVGNDTGDMPGELQNWVARYPLRQTFAFPTVVTCCIGTRKTMCSPC